MAEIYVSNELRTDFMRKTVPGPFWLQYYMDKNSPTTILVPVFLVNFFHIIIPLFEYCKIPYKRPKRNMRPQIWNQINIPDICPYYIYVPPSLPPPHPREYKPTLDKFWKHKH